MPRSRPGWGCADARGRRRIRSSRSPSLLRAATVDPVPRFWEELRLRFGLALPSFSFSDLDYGKAARLREFARRAEAFGYEALWVVEHLLTACGLSGTPWLSP